VPVYFFHGRYDYTCSYELAKQYFVRIQAAVKGFYTFEHSAHSPIFEEPEKMNKILVDDVLNSSTELADNIVADDYQKCKLSPRGRRLKQLPIVLGHIAHVRCSGQLAVRHIDEVASAQQLPQTIEVALLQVDGKLSTGVGTAMFFWPTSVNDSDRLSLSPSSRFQGKMSGCTLLACFLDILPCCGRNLSSPTSGTHRALPGDVPLF